MAENKCIYLVIFLCSTNTHLEIFCYLCIEKYNKPFNNNPDMNKVLYTKVKDLCKGTHLSDKYLKGLTENLGASVEDDCTDEEKIEEAANQVATVAKLSQGEATRWAQRAKDNANQDPDDEDNQDPDDEDQDLDPEKGKAGKGKGKKAPKNDDPNDERIKKLEKELADMKAEKSKSQRDSEIQAAFEKHKIPTYLRKRLAKSISDDEDLEEAVSSLKQDLITDGLMPDEQEGAKAVSDKQVDEAADSLLESITAK